MLVSQLPKFVDTGHGWPCTHVCCFCFDSVSRYNLVIFMLVFPKNLFVRKSHVKQCIVVVVCCFFFSSYLAYLHVTTIFGRGGNRRVKEQFRYA